MESAPPQPEGPLRSVLLIRFGICQMSPKRHWGYPLSTEHTLSLSELSGLSGYNIFVIYWLVVSTPLKNISQLGLSFPYIIENKIHVPNHQPVYYRPFKIRLKSSVFDNTII